MEGWIKLHRKLLDWEWYSDTNAKVLFLHCLLKANIKDTTWKGMEIKRGQFFTSNLSLSNELGLSIKEIRNSLKKLEKTGELTFFGASNGTMVTVCNYDNYQHFDETKGKRGASEGQARGKQRATDKEEEEREEEKKEKELLGGEPPEKKNDVYDFVSDEFYFFYEWLEYKKDRREKYKSKKSIEAAYNKLLKLSDGNPIIARQILENSYASNYAGFFPIKPNNQYNPTSQPKNPKIVTQTGYNGFKFD